MQAVPGGEGEGEEGEQVTRKLQPWRNFEDYMDWLSGRPWIGKAVLAYIAWVLSWIVVGTKWGTGHDATASIVTACALAAILLPFAVLASPVVVMLWRYRPADKEKAK